MRPDEIRRVLEEVSRRLRRVELEAEAPAVARSVRLARMYCHLARFQLGEVQEWHPLLPEEER